MHTIESNFIATLRPYTKAAEYHFVCILVQRYFSSTKGASIWSCRRGTTCSTAVAGKRTYVSMTSLKLIPNVKILLFLFTTNEKKETYYTVQEGTPPANQRSTGHTTLEGLSIVKNRLKGVN